MTRAAARAGAGAIGQRWPVADRIFSSPIGGGVGRQLLLFYSDRAEARRAATKFALVWGAGDLALVLAPLALWQAFGTVRGHNAGITAQLGIAAQGGLPLAGPFGARAFWSWRLP